MRRNGLYQLYPVGVSRCGDRYRAQPCLDGRTRYAGVFDTAAQAAAAVGRVTRYHGLLTDQAGAVAQGQVGYALWDRVGAELAACWAKMTAAERRCAGLLRLGQARRLRAAARALEGAAHA